MEEDMKLLGFFGIFKHSIKTIFSRKQIFAQITLTLILPLAIVFLAYVTISDRLFWSLFYLHYYSDFSIYHKINFTLWLYYCLSNIIYFTLLTVLSLLSTAAVVFTIASIYTDRDVMTVFAPKIWRKVYITYVCIYLTLLVYDVITDVVMVMLRFIFGYSILGLVLVHVFLVLDILGFLYLTVVWQLASVVTVLENNNINGFEAMKRGRILANGKKKVGMGIVFILYGVLFGLMCLYQVFADQGDEVSGLGMIWSVLIGILCGILIMMVFLLFVVTQTVLYLVCKSYHREGIDKVSLSTFLSGYIGETVVNPKPDEEIQLGRTQTQPLAY